MSANLSWNSPAPLWLRTGAGALVIALHVVVVGGMLLAGSKMEPAPKPQVISVRFVQIAPTVQQAEPPPPVPPKPTPPKPVLPKPKPVSPKPKPLPPREPLPVSDTALSTPVPPPPVQTPAPPVESSVPTPPVAEKSVPAPAPAAPVSNQPRQVGQVEYVRAPQVVYPRTSQRMGERGTVVVRVVINTRGTVDSVTIQKTSGYDRLDAAALDAVKRALFKPPSENGVAFVGIADVPINFNLKD